MLRVPEVARALDVHRDTVYRRIARGDIPAIRLGDGKGSLRIPLDELKAWLNREETTA